ncbi:putative pectinesterase [Medicago truncatula]|uniref:Pectinesterase n=1 Tax=Medicago truncatula TaxID=3880 RepID=A0A396II13_MEDTR|nr:probable pectinesterase/pectinesterase inhibitor 12 [Medicago truncatula]RHN64511.1 putative pectinesterase [Medicago truncatula]
MANLSSKLFLLLLTIFHSPTSAFNNTTSSSTTLHAKISSIKSFCRNTPYPEVCFNSSKLSISIDINPNIINILLHSLQVSISETTKLSNQFNNAHSNIVENKRGAIQDCEELQQSTLSSLKRSLSGIRSSKSRKLVDARTYLSAALTNKNTCLESLDSASGTLKQVLVDSVINTYKHVSNSLSMFPKPEVRASKGHGNRRLMDALMWLSSKDHRRFLQSTDNVIVVAADGTGNFSTINEAIEFAPNNSYARIIIYVKEGIYEENVEISSNKTNIVLLGDGRDQTVITGNRSDVDGWTTFRSATLAVSGEGFLARDIAFENKAGPEKHQAVALRVNADVTAFYKCAMYGYQDTLYVHSFRQFYRECDIFGTIDYIFGNAAVVLQACNIISRMPLPNQYTVITAQSRDSPDEDTGISIQNCSILATTDLYNNYNNIKSYLGRPWRVYSRTVFIESYIDVFIDPMGWTKWSSDDDKGLDTLYYGEFANYGPGSATDNRVKWLGYHLMDFDSANNFTVSEFIIGDAWIGSTSFPYDDGI